MRYKNWWFSLILGLLMPGFGHIYNGRMKKGAFIALSYHLFVLGLATIAVTHFTTQTQYVVSFIITGVLWIALALMGVFEVYHKKIPAKTHPLDHWYILFFLFLLLRFGLTIPLFALAETHWVHFYYVPSKSMQGTLLVGDQIIANTRTIKRGYTPQAGNICTFKNIIDKDAFWVKRIVGEAGDHITVDQSTVRRNKRSIPWPQKALPCVDSLIICNLSYEYTLPKKGETFTIKELSELEFLFLYRLIKQERRKNLANGELYVYTNNMLTTSLDLDTIDNIVELQKIQKEHKKLWPLSEIRYQPVLFLETGTPLVTYTLTEDSFFFLGDNRANSYDSRLFGPVSSASITAVVKAILLSFNKNDPGRFSIHLSRTGKPVQ